MDNTKIVETQDLYNDFKRPNLLGVRHVHALQWFFGAMFGIFLQVNISSAIVPMTQATAGQPYHNWNSSTKSIILSSFSWGYVVAQIPLSLLAKRFGAKIVFVWTTVAGSIITIFHPLAANQGGWQLVCGLRVLVGITQSAVLPCLHTLLAHWIPRTERSLMGTFVYSGAHVGIVVLLAVSGSIYESSIGWPGIFYITGVLGILWSVIFLIFGANTPNDTKISQAEQEYIEALTGSDRHSECLPIPWKSILTSLPFYGLMAAHCGFAWGFLTLLNEIPSYMSSVLHSESDTLLSAIPYCAMLVLGLIFSPICDMLINRRVVSVTVARKLFTSLGHWVPMVCLIALGYTTEDDKTLAIVLLSIAVGFISASLSGFYINHMDLSPNFAGPMMGITNFMAMVCSICAPLVVGAIVQNEEDPVEWRIIFFIAAGVYLVSNTLYLILGTAITQPWNDVNYISATGILQNNLAEIDVSATSLERE